MTERPLTERQQAVLDALERYVEDNGYSPTVRELAAIVGLQTHQTVVRILNILRQEGYIEGRARTLRVR